MEQAGGEELDDETAVAYKMLQDEMKGVFFHFHITFGRHIRGAY